MSTVIYLANQQIQVITGTPGKSKDFCRGLLYGRCAGWQHHQWYDYGCGCVCELHAELLDDT